MKWLNGVPVRDEQYFEKVNNFRSTFDFDENNFCLLKSGSCDCSEYLQENEDCNFKTILSKFGFLPQNLNVSYSTPVSDDIVPCYSERLDDFVELSNITSSANFLREKYNMPDDFSVEQVFNRCREIAVDFKAKLSDDILKSKLKEGGDIDEAKS